MEAYYGTNGFLYEHKLDDEVQARTYRQHAHNAYELLRLHDGEAALVVDGLRYPLSRGDLALIPSAVFHFVDILAPSRYEREILHFERIDVEERVLREVFASPAVLHVPEGSALDLHLSRFSELCRLFEGEALARLLPNLLVELLYRLTRMEAGASQRAAAELNATVSAAIRYFERNPSAVRIEELCAELYVSRSTLHRAFRSVLGVSPMRYASVRRLLRAESRISRGEPPTAVSEALGYRDYSSFYRAYRAQFGHSPRIRQSLPPGRADE